MDIAEVGSTGLGSVRVLFRAGHCTHFGGGNKMKMHRSVTWNGSTWQRVVFFCLFFQHVTLAHPTLPNPRIPRPR